MPCHGRRMPNRWEGRQNYRAPTGNRPHTREKDRARGKRRGKSTMGELDRPRTREIDRARAIYHDCKRGRGERKREGGRQTEDLELRLAARRPPAGRPCRGAGLASPPGLRTCRGAAVAVRSSVVESQSARPPPVFEPASARPPRVSASIGRFRAAAAHPPAPPPGAVVCPLPPLSSLSLVSQRPNLLDVYSVFLNIECLVQSCSVFSLNIVCLLLCF